MPKVITLSTCHNRPDKTVSALNSLISSFDPTHVELCNIIVDDSSDYNTYDLVKAQDLSVTFIRGSGDMYWAGAMRHGFNYIEANNIDYDFIFAYNDDVIFFENIIPSMCDFAISEAYRTNNPSCIVIGSTKSSLSDECTYGSLRKMSLLNHLQFMRLSPTDLSSASQIDTFNMNAVLISRPVIHKVKPVIQNHFVHRSADIDFGLRASRSGCHLACFDSFVGICDRHDFVDSVTLKRKTFFEYFTYMLSPKNKPLPSHFIFCLQNAGPLWVFIFLKSYININLIVSFKNSLTLVFHRLRGLFAS